MRLPPPATALLLFGLPLASTAEPEAGGDFDPQPLARIDRAVAEAIKRKKLPGGVLWIEHEGASYKKAFGNRSNSPAVEKMTVDTIFDAASLTKVVATTPCIMKLIEEGKIGLDDKAQKHLPELTGDPNKDAVTIRHLLTHCSGLGSGIRRGYTWSGYENGVALALGELSYGIAGLSYRYSDINFILLGEIVRRVSGQALDRFAEQTVFGPLKMTDTRFRPPENLTERIAPTTPMAGGRVLCGTVHDPTARPMGGVAGHAGLFTSARDLARYAALILNRGELDGVRILKSDTVELMTSVQSPKLVSVRRGLGWDIDSPYAGPRGKHFPRGSFGHTGWTGGSLWIDPFSQTTVIFLSNRTHLSSGRVVDLRKEIGTLAAEAVGFDFAKVKGALGPASPATERATAKETAARRGTVLNGIDVLAAQNFAPLKGLKVGLITNHTGISRNRKPTVDLMHAAKGFELVSLFSPEHGIRGMLEGNVKGGIDKKTKLPIHSLYAGKTKRKPTPEMLAGLDALVFDIQDIGTRFYTYLSTMGTCMEAAEEAGLKFFVLDRVNPIGGEIVDGPVRVGDGKFTSFHPIAVRHGMTAGEVARMFKNERCPKLDLTVVPVKNWKRDMLFDQTGLPWLSPSPNIRNLTGALLYPGLGILEFTNVSVGRGTKLPFELFGAPYIDPDEFAATVRAARVPGIDVVPVRFTPSSSKHANKSCGGLRLLVKNRRELRSVDLGIVLARALQHLYPDHWDSANINTLLRHPDTAAFIRQGPPLDIPRRSWSPAIEKFAKQRKKVLLYE